MGGEKSRGGGGGFGGRDVRRESQAEMRVGRVVRFRRGGCSRRRRQERNRSRKNNNSNNSNNNE